MPFIALKRPRRIELPMLLFIVTLLCSGCDDSESGDSGDLEYYCEQQVPSWCAAYADCDPFNFATYFPEGFEQCVEQSRNDCLDPRSGQSRCDGATVAETDDCVAYLDTHHPDGCHLLFGPQADLSLCEEICLD